jgi:hypothetical protein
MTVVFWILIAYAVFFVFLAITPVAADQPSSLINPYQPRESLVQASVETDEPRIVVGTDLAM